MPRHLLAAPFLLVLHAAQAPEDGMPSLFFREDWNNKPAPVGGWLYAWALPEPR